MRFNVSLVAFYLASVAAATVISATHSYNYGEPDATEVAPGHSTSSQGAGATQPVPCSTTQTGPQSPGTPGTGTHASTTEAGPEPSRTSVGAGPQSPGNTQAGPRSSVYPHGGAYSTTSRTTSQPSATSQLGPHSSVNHASSQVPEGSHISSVVGPSTRVVVTETVTVIPRPTQATSKPAPPPPKPSHATSKHVSPPPKPTHATPKPAPPPPKPTHHPPPVSLAPS